MYGEEWVPPPPLANVSPSAMRVIESSGILDFIPHAKRCELEDLFAWHIQQAIKRGDDPEGSQGFTIRLEHHQTGEVGLWRVLCEMLHPEAEYYGVLDVTRIVPDGM